MTTRISGSASRNRDLNLRTSRSQRVLKSTLRLPERVALEAAGTAYDPSVYAYGEQNPSQSPAFALKKAKSARSNAIGIRDWEFGSVRYNDRQRRHTRASVGRQRD
jgi:hypothetical protein